MFALFSNYISYIKYRVEKVICYVPMFCWLKMSARERVVSLADGAICYSKTLIWFKSIFVKLQLTRCLIDISLIVCIDRRRARGDSLGKGCYSGEGQGSDGECVLAPSLRRG